ncbi:hydrogenase 4 subunit F [Inmirania thermothiophila]|uniref:Hydrogenase-4 component F n=1 Tax=Inmirania thermothiophila TaxID=1750597 RepID=A0A3N1XWH7_9GAMM|nr:hydrogenase 4 subunit F [Inmirania thermothiophila]ROR29552.1 hydrogenase-4 component F [Inmirania thermothiophila]
MNTALLATLGVPAAAAPLLALAGAGARAAHINAAASGLGFAAAAWLAREVFARGPVGGGELYVDAFNVYLILLTAFVGLTTAVFSGPYMAHEAARGRVGPARMRLYHASFQGFLFTMLLALATNNLGVLWVALEGATLATVLLVSLYRTPESVEAAWKYFILCGVGIAQALFGTVLLYFAAARVVPDPERALLWTELHARATELEPVVMGFAFVFVLVGYGTKVGLVPLHNWLPDAHSEGPTPISAILSGLLLNVALYAVVRIKMLADGALAAGSVHDPALAGRLMMAFGLLSFLVAGLFLHRQRDIKRLFSYSSIEHMGLMTFAFGLGSPLATFGALLHMTVHSLTKSAIFVTVGHASQIAGTQSLERIRGLISTQPAVGWGLLIGAVAIAGFPPFGIFASEFLLLTATMQSWPWLTVALLSGIVVAFAGLFRHMHPVVFGPRPQDQSPIPANMVPVAVHLAIVLWLGLAMPGFLARWFDEATRLIAGSGLL